MARACMVLERREPKPAHDQHDHDEPCPPQPLAPPGEGNRPGGATAARLRPQTTAARLRPQIASGRLVPQITGGRLRPQPGGVVLLYQRLGIGPDSPGDAADVPPGARVAAAP